MGNACNGGPLHVLGLGKSHHLALPPPIDFCGGADPVIRRSGSKVVIELPGGPPNRGTGHLPGETWIFEKGSLLRQPAAASTRHGAPRSSVPTVTIAGKTKVTVATVRKITDGDVACYLELVDDSGRRHEEMGEFTLCGKRKSFLNRRVKLSYGLERVIHEDCLGDPACRKTRTEVMIRSAAVLD
jgi:hypothetical protein